MEKKDLVVLDTNVFVSGLLSPSGTPGIILSKFRKQDFDIATSKVQIREIQNVLSRPSLAKAVPTGTIRDALRFFLEFKKLTHIYSPPSLDWDFEDPADHFLLDLVVESKADFLVTGDRALRGLTLIANCAVVSPAEFLKRI